MTSGVLVDKQSHKVDNTFSALADLQRHVESRLRAIGLRHRGSTGMADDANAAKEALEVLEMYVAGSDKLLESRSDRDIALHAQTETELVGKIISFAEKQDKQTLRDGDSVALVLSSAEFTLQEKRLIKALVDDEVLRKKHRECSSVYEGLLLGMTIKGPADIDGASGLRRGER